jgi:hypothetical protein
VEAVLHVSIDRKSAYIEKSAPGVKRRTGRNEVPAASEQNHRRVIIRPPHHRPKEPRDAVGVIEPVAEDSGAMNKRHRLIMAARVVLAAGPALTANGSPADAVINGTYTSSMLLAGVTAKYRF